MPRATTCELDGRIVDVEEALRPRDEASRRAYPEFGRRECGEPG